MEFMLIEGSYILKDKKLHKVPSTESEALHSSLMGLFEKRRCASFLSFVQKYKEDGKSKYDVHKMTFAELVKKFDLDAGTVDFLGNAVALELDSSFLQRPAIETMKKLQLYEESQAQYEKSPYVYPCYGLSDIPQAFARLCAVHGGTYMLGKAVDRIVFDEKGVFVGVESEGQIAKAKFVVGDPTYFPDKTRKVGQVVRAICIMDHPIKEGTKSCQIILPAKETKRKTDMYILQVSGVHKVCPDGLFLAIVSATVETPKPEEEIAPGLKLLGAVREKFVNVYDSFLPETDGSKDHAYISKSLDATSHFETCVDDILSLYQRITGKPYQC